MASPGFAMAHLLEFLLRIWHFFFGDALDSVKEPEWIEADKGNVLIVGGLSGLGKEQATLLAAQGFRVFFTTESEEKGKEVMHEIRERSGSQAVEHLHLDLMSIASIRSFAASFSARNLPLHILAHNAGIFPGLARGFTKDGLERAFQVNFAGHLLLSDLLLDRVKEAQPAGRVLFMSSNAHWEAQLDLGDLQGLKAPYDPFNTYANSKFMVMLLVSNLRERLAREGRPDIAVACCHPGNVFTGLVSGLVSGITRWAAMMVLKDVTKGVRTQMYLSLVSPDKILPHVYFADCRPASHNPLAHDLTLAATVCSEARALIAAREKKMTDL